MTRHLKRGEFLLLIVGDGIREDVEDIVGFVQRHSGLHFNLALVEAALYRDGASRIIVQPRVLARTEIVRRDVVDYEVGDGNPIDDETPDEALSVEEKENLRFWEAVLQHYSFSDVDVEVPTPSNHSVLRRSFRQSGSTSGSSGLSFAAFISRRGRQEIGCYLSRRNDLESASRIFEQVRAILGDLRDEAGNDPESWTNPKGLPRIGFRRETAFPLPADDANEEFRAAVAWMREHLDRLVSTLHPRLRRMIAEI